MRIKEIWMGQWRWIGGDEWTNCTCIGFTEQQAKDSILQALNEDIFDHNKDDVEFGEGQNQLRPYVSLEHAAQDGELLWQVWLSETNFDLPSEAIVA